MFKSLFILILCGFSVLIAGCGAGSKTNPADIRITCIGSACPAAGVSSFANTSAQVWTGRNPGDQPIVVDINFSNLASGQELAYVFGNGYSPSSNSLPNVGQPSTADGSAGKATPGSTTMPELRLQGEVYAMEQRQDRWRLQKSGAEDRLLATLRQQRGPESSSPSSGLQASAVSGTSVGAPAVGTRRTWIDNSDDEPKPYVTGFQSSCLDGDGRQVVVWADDAALSTGSMDKKARDAFQSTLCGTNGAVARLGRLLGKVWGPLAGPALIAETADKLQSIHVVVISEGAEQPWAGYFNGVNSFLRTAGYPESNEALVFFINADAMKVSLPFIQSVLIHELTHMIYWYERSVRMGAPRLDTWLTEMSAMMSEDILAPALVRDAAGQPFQTILNHRLPAYLNTGGGLSMVDWAEIENASPYYSMAGSFGAYLNRQYGLSVYKDLLRECAALRSGWDCLDKVIKKNGGQSAADEFNQFGLTVFGLGDASGPSRKYSFARKVDEGYVLEGRDLSALRTYRPAQSRQVTNWSTGTHAYFTETANLNIFTFTRRGITIPPRSQLNIMVRQ